jgi:catechol 2,3-dioxygenase-like lactoylglutathione lyase family enzyme
LGALKVQVLGVVFVGTATAERDQMSVFVRDVLGLEQLHRPDVEADMFRLQEGSTFAIASPGGMGPTERSIGFLVDDLDTAVAELRSAGTRVDEPTANAAERYVHFVAPDGQLYELIQHTGGN